MDPYLDRNMYRALSAPDDLKSFRVTVEETDLFICAASVLREPAEAAVLSARRMVREALRQRPEFLTSLTPLEPAGGEPPLILGMLKAAQAAGTGPMAAVAGAIAQYVGQALLPVSREILIENGGDVFLAGNHLRTVAIVAGNSPLSGRLGLRFRPGRGIGVCTSSGTYGHSLSFGRSDAAVVCAADAALADAVATMLGNRCRSREDLAAAAEWAAGVSGVRGAAVVLGDAFAAAGDLDLVPLQVPEP